MEPQLRTPFLWQCFHPEQLIGNKFIKDLQPGDLINGIEIIGMVLFKVGPKFTKYQIHLSCRSIF